MVILANKNIPKQALQQLSVFGKIILFQTKGITYPAIAGHPDIFLCDIMGVLAVAPNVPASVKIKLKEQKIELVEGYLPVGHQYPETARYNCVLTEDYLIGNKDLIDKKIWERAIDKVYIHVKQGYTGCNLLPLAENRFITSDKGIKKALTDKGLEVLYVNPEGILLPGFKHGFFGGCCGIFESKIFFIGNLKHYPEGEKVRQFLSGYEIIELYDGPLFDGGSIMFL